MRLAQIILARDVTATRFDDLTAAQLTGEPHWVPGEPDVLEVPFDRDVTPAERTRIRRRLVTPDAATEAHVTALAEGRAALKALPTQSNATIKAIVASQIAVLDSLLKPYGE